jgi:hypothetical protein
VTAATVAVLLDVLLRAHVSSQGVDYEGLAKQRAALDEVVTKIASATGEQPLSFHLNAYNALVLSKVVMLGRPKSVLDHKGFFDADKHTVAGRSVTLNELETHIRGHFKDPRIHFALSCASKSCPPLMARAFQEKTLDADLASLTRAFLDGPGIQVTEAGQVRISRLFEWYEQDFRERDGSVVAFLRKWVTEPSRKAALSVGAPAIQYQEYDWRLNAAP